MRDSVICFHVICTTSLGQEVRIAGNHPDLGQWDLTRSLTLTTQPNQYPRWKSKKRIVVGKMHNLQFKVWISFDGKFKRWENIACDQNRHYLIHLRSVTVVLIADSMETLQEKVQPYIVSEEMYIEQVKRFNQNQLFNDQQNSSSSGDGFDNYFHGDDFSMEPRFNIDQIVGVFRELTTRGENFPVRKDVGMDDDKIVTLTKRIMHVISNDVTLEGASANRIVVQLAVDSQLAANSNNKADQIIQRVGSSGQCVIFHGLSMGLIVKSIRKKISNANCFQMGLWIKSLSGLQPLLEVLPISSIVECLVLCNSLIFASFEVLQQTLDLIQSEGLPIRLKCHKIGTYVLTTLDRLIVLRMVDHHQQIGLDAMEFQQIHPDCIIKKRIQNIRSTEEDSRHSKLVGFSFGAHQSLDVLLENRQIINTLCESHLVYVMTPVRLNNHSQTIAQFPNILFISYNYLEIEYDKSHRVIQGVHFYSPELVRQTSKVMTRYPQCSYTIQNNVLLIKNSDTSALGIKGFKRVEVELQEVISGVNRSKQSKQSKSLMLTKINSSLIEIRQTFQTQLIFTKIIIQTSETRIDFILLLMASRFQNFRFLELLKSLVYERYCATSVLAYSLGLVRNRHCCNLSGDELGQILCRLQDNKSRKGSLKGFKSDFKKYLF